MDEEDEKKKKKRDWGSIIINVVRFAKYMTNPVFYWAVIISVFLIIIIGFISYFLSIPGQLLGRLNDYIDKVKDSLGIGQITVKQEEVYDLCKYLEEMGYDVEAYGFVETVERGKDKKTYDDEKFDNNKPTKGTIKDNSVKSKYLEAYIISEKKLYAISNEANYFAGTINEVYNMSGIIEEAINTIFGTFENEKETLTKYIKLFKQNDNIPQSEIDLEIRRVIAYYGYTLYKGTRNGTIFLQSIVNLFGAAESDFIKWMKLDIHTNPTLEPEQDTKGYLKTLEDLIQNEYISIGQEYTYSGDGLIFLENNKGTYKDVLSGNWIYGGDEKVYGIEIDKDNKQFIIKMNLPAKTFFEALGITRLSKYAYDLNNWTTKYGKSQDFLIGAHIATMAPDFTYRLATATAVDTKVHVALFETDIDLKVVTEDKSDISVLDLINAANEDTFILNELKSKLRKIIEQLNYSDIPQSMANEIKGKLGEYYKSLVWFSTPPYTGIPDRDEVRADADNIDNRISGITLTVFKNKLSEAFSQKTIINFFKKLDELILNRYRDNEVSTLREKIEELKKLTIATIGIQTSDDYKPIDDLPFGNFESMIRVIEEIQEPIDVATPYITKVVRHWYRNQYFTNVGGDTEYYKRLRCKELIYNIYNIILDGALDREGMAGATSHSDIARKVEQEKKNIETKNETELDAFIAGYKSAWENGSLWDRETLTEDQIKRIDNEFKAITAQFGNASFSGGAYKIEANPEPYWFMIDQLVEKGAKFSEDVAIAEYLLKFAIKEQRSMDIIQIHNPLFEDNSLYIRSWLKEKYTIYDGRNTRSTNNDSVIMAGSQEKYIQGKEALRELEAQMEQVADVRTDMVFMIRNLKELFEDFEFDLENRDVPSAKVLTNIMPDYKPYTVWPSMYEKNESNYTKMIYKGQSDGNISSGTVSADLVAPETCIIRAISSENGGGIDIEFTPTVGDGVVVFGMTLRIQGENSIVSCNREVGATIKKGEKIGTITGEPVILKLSLFTGTKQIVRIEDYMKVESREYKDLTKEEKQYLYGLLANEIKEYETDEKAFAKANAIVSVVLNRIASPMYKNEKGIVEVLKKVVSKSENIDEKDKSENDIGFSKFSIISEDDLEKYEEIRAFTSGITTALRGSDMTRDETLLGATRYYKSPYTKGDEGLTKDLQKEIEKFKTYKVIDNMLFGLTVTEYKDYLAAMIDKKIDEVMYELDLKKYLEGFEESEGGYDTSYKIMEHQKQIKKMFQKAKDLILEYCETGNYQEDCGGIKLKEDDKLVRILEKSNVYQEQEEQDNRRDNKDNRSFYSYN